MPHKRLLILGLLTVIFLPVVVTAQVNFDPVDNNKNYTSSKALTFLSGAYDPVNASINITNAALRFLGLISVILFLYAGFIWFRSGDNEEEVKKAKDIIIGAIVGLVLTLSAYGISYLVFGQLNNATFLNDSAYEAQFEG